MDFRENSSSDSGVLDRLGIAKDKVSVKLGKEDDVVQKEIAKAIDSDRTEPVEEIIANIQSRLEEVTNNDYLQEEIGLIWIFKGGKIAQEHLENAEQIYNSEDLEDSGLIEMRQDAIEAERVFDRCLSVAQACDFDELDLEETSVQRVRVDGEKLDESDFKEKVESMVNSFHQNSEKAEQIYRKAEQQLNNIPEF